jgi:two-component system response regulator WspF
MIKIAIVNAQVSVMQELRQALQAAGYPVLWTATNGADAIALCQKQLPDLLLMDLHLPTRDGVQTTQEIMRLSPCAILLVTPSVQKNLGQVYAAMGYGALDVVDIPLRGDEAAKERFFGKIKTMSKLAPKKSSFSGSSSLVAIGSSTGGLKALADILSALPSNFAAAIVIVQHVDLSFSGGLITWVNQQTPLPVQAARSGDRLTKGRVLVASSKDHLYVLPDQTLGYTPHPQDYPYRPSVDVFFHSLAQYWPTAGVAVLLTGMGKDGALGLKALSQKGWHTIAQEEASCSVYGMPKAAVELQAAKQILPPRAIAQTLLQKFP